MKFCQMQIHPIFLHHFQHLIYIIYLFPRVLLAKQAHLVHQENVEKEVKVVLLVSLGHQECLVNLAHQVFRAHLEKKASLVQRV